jgi:response regulator of citrate/malate metabolism
MSVFYLPTYNAKDFYCKIMLYSDIEKIKIQNYACQGCSNCSSLKEIDLRTRQGVFTYLIKKRSCYLTRLQSKILSLQEKVKVVEKEIKQYQEALENELKNN